MWWSKSDKETDLNRLQQAVDTLDRSDGAPLDSPELEALRLEIRGLRAAHRLGYERLGKEVYWGLVILVAAVILLLLQNGLLWRQIWQQQANLEMSRRVQLLNLVFEPTDCDRDRERRRLQFDYAKAEDDLDQEEPGSPAALRLQNELKVIQSRDPEICPPRAPLRLREEAVVTLSKIDGERLALRRSNLRRMSLRNIHLAGTNLSGADLSGGNFSDGNFRNAYLRRISGVGTYLKGANLRLTTLKDADLTAAYLTEADLTDADLKGATLVKANLIRTLFLRTNLKDVDFTDADIGGADLSGALSLTQAQLDSAHGTAKTIIPSGLRRPSTWSTRKK